MALASTCRRLLLLVLPALGAAVRGAPAPPRADEGDRVVLKSGRELVGRYEGERDRRLYFLDDEIGRVAVARRNVRAILRAGEEPGLFAPILLEADPAPPPRSWVRFDPPGGGRPGHLLTGISRLFEPRTRTTLFLVGAVHIGEPAYYARLQDVLDSCDLVLVEGVGGGGGGEAAGADELASMDAVTRLQIALKDALGLQFQKDGLDYSHPSWRNADVDLASFSRRMKDEGVALPTESPLFRALMRFVVGAFDLSRAGEDPAMRRMLRRQAASAIATADTLFAGGLRKLGSVLVDWRNDAALRVLDEELAAGRKGRWIALFYGAAHLPDLAAKVAERGFEHQRCGWLAAWTVE